MGLVSKILLGLNVVAAAAFVYLAVGDWGKRQEWTFRVFQQTVALKGLPLDGEPADGDTVPFDFAVNDAVRLDSIRSSTLARLIPPGSGGSEYGGEPVASQTAEIRRVQKKVANEIDVADGPAAKRVLLLKYLNNLAPIGAQRDGAIALLRDSFTAQRRAGARREIGLLARTPVQADTLAALASIGDKTVSIRRAVLDLLKSTAPLGISGLGDAGKDSAQQITNAVADIENAGKAEPADAAALAAGKAKLLALVTGEDLKGALSSMIELLGLSLDDPAKAETVKKALRDIALGLARTEPEKATLNALADALIEPAVGEEQAIASGKAALVQYFEEAAAPASRGPATPGKPVLEANEKARMIAHVLSQLDADKADFAARLEWHRRVSSVVGMPRYVEAANTQAIALGDMARRLRGILREEEGVFRSDYLAQKQSATDLADRLSGLTQELGGLQAQKSAAEANTNDRARERENLERNLEDNRASAKRYLAELAARERDIFALLGQMNTAKAELLDLERKVGAKEREIESAGGKTKEGGR